MHRLRWTVEYQHAAGELRTALLRASRSAPYASRGPRQIQLEKNLQSLSNCAPETFVELLFSAQDLGVSIDQLVAVPDTLAALLRARSHCDQQLPLRSLLSMETSIESATNPVQWLVGTGEASTSDKHELLRLALKNEEIWKKIRQDLERELFGEKGKRPEVQQ